MVKAVSTGTLEPRVRVGIAQMMRSADSAFFPGQAAGLMFGPAIGYAERSRTMRLPSLVPIAALFLLMPACNKKGGEATPQNAAAQKEADQVWNSRCVSCHGNAGKGDGPAAAALDPKPRSFSSVKWQASVNDDHIKKVIVGGGSAIGKSALMAPNPDLKGKDAVLDLLVKKVRSFAK